MVTYTLGCILSSFLVGIFKKKYENDKKSIAEHNYLVLYAFFAGLPLTIISAIRYDVGKDYLMYKLRFSQIAAGSEIKDFEVLFSLLNKAISKLGGDYTWLFAITSIIFVTLVMATIIRDSSLPELSAYLLVTTTYYFSAMNGIRQMIGCSIVLFSIHFIESRKLIPFSICIIIAAGFHHICLLFFIAYFIYDYSFSRKFVVFSTLLIGLLSPIISKLINYITSFTKYYWYWNSTYAESKSGGYITFSIGALILVFALLCFSEEDKHFQFFLKMQTISVWLSFFVDKVPMIQRVKWVFGLSVIILIPLILKNLKDGKTRSMATISIYTLYYVYFYYSVGINNSNSVIPYQTIFSNGVR